jgi:integrase
MQNMIFNPTWSANKFAGLLGKKRRNLEVSTPQIDFEHQLRCTSQRVLQLAKLAMCHGALNEEWLLSLRHVPQNVWSVHYISKPADEKHHSINSIAIEKCAEALEASNSSYDPWLVDAQKQQFLIAELLKLGREFRECAIDNLDSASVYGEDDHKELYHALKTLKDFLNQSRRIERIQTRSRHQELQLKTCVEEFLITQDLGTGFAQYKLALKRLMLRFGETTLVSEFTPEIADQMIQCLRIIHRGRDRWVLNGKKVQYVNGLTPKTTNKYINNYFVFFEWLINRHRYKGVNPFAGAKIPRASKSSLKRRAFVGEEIEQILNYKPSALQEAKSFRSAAQWIPVIGLYTGMRPVEIVSLRVIHIQQKNGIYLISLRDQKGKTSNSRRIVPIHSKLIRLGFLDYVKSLQEQQEIMLFPDLYEDGNYECKRQALDKISKWFNRTAMKKMNLHKKTEIIQGILLDLYCCRHTVTSTLKEKGVSGYLIKSLLGHYPENEITFGVYAGEQDVSLEALRDAVELIQYEKLFD